MKVYLFNGNGKIEITSIITSLTISGEYRSCCRILSFGIIKSETDLNTHVVPINLGNNIKIVEGGKVIFHGVVWSRSKPSDANEINLTCKDYGIYLLKNRGSYKFSNIKPEDVVKKVCSDFGIKTGSIASTGKAISRKFLGVTLYDIIKTCYTIANDKKYMIVFEGDKLNVIEKGIVGCDALESGINLLTSNVTESLENMVNRVNVYNKSDKLIKSYEDENNIRLYGLMSEYIKVSDTKEDYSLRATKALKGIERKISVSNFGDAQYTTGKFVEVKEPYNGLIGRFYIDADNHNWKNGIYTNKLTLNFENLMDESESGSEDKK